MAPITANPAAMRRPVNVAGMAAGNWSLNSRVVRLALCSEKRSWRSRSTDFSPNRALVMIGNSEIKTAMITRLLNPNPNHTPMRGTRARVGTVWITTAHGKNASSMRRDWLIRTAKRIPSAMAIARPVNATLLVLTKPSKSSARVASSPMASVIIVWGWGTRILRFSGTTSRKP